MRLLRSLANACLRPLVAETTPEIRAIDGRILRGLARLGSTLRIPNAEAFGEEWMLDYFRIIAGAITDTPYGSELDLPYPLVISVSSSNKCALGCSFCYSNSTVAPSREARLNRELCAKIANSPIPIVLITGGEPFHHPQLIEVLEPILASGKKIFIATNAPSSRVAEQLLAYRQQITVLLSQWGRKPRHEAVRGRGNLERTWAGVERLTSFGYQVYLNFVLSSDNISEDFEALEEILIASPQLDRVYLSRELLVGRAPVITRPSTDNRALWRRVDVLCDKFPGRVVPNLPELLPAEGTSVPPLLTRLLGIVFPPSCGAAMWTLHVDSQGICYPCFAHEGRLSIGSLWADDFETIWERARSVRKSSFRMTGAGCWAERSEQFIQLGRIQSQEDG
jgi:MoaA/NifB/PqqE/SkfB family radical SAM enzyme